MTVKKARKNSVFINRLPAVKQSCISAYMKFLILGSQQASLVNFRGPLIRELMAGGHEVVAVAPEPDKVRHQQLLDMGARYIESPMARAGINPFKDAALTFWLWRLLKREQPDVMLAFHAKPVIYGTLAATLAGVKKRTAMIEGLGQGFAADASGLKRRLIRFILPWLYRFGLCGAHTVFFLNSDDREEFYQRGIIKHQKVVLLPGIGIDLEHFAQKTLPPAPVTFLMVARLLIDKGVRDYAAAAALLKTEYPEVQFHLLGPLDPTPAGVKAEEVKTWQPVTWLGETADVRPFLEACHVFVLPTFYREGLPRSILEAMAIGRAILTTSAPGARETVVAGGNGYLVESRNPQALAAAMERLLLAQDQLQAMGEASRRLAEERYEVGRINRQIIAALTDGI